MNNHEKIGVIGAGLVGTLLAIHLRKLGYETLLYDRSDDIRTINFKGKSINLAISTRGWKALETVGLVDEIKEITLPMYKRAIHNISGEIQYQNYGVNNEAIYSVSRGELNKKMVQLAEDVGTEFRFNHKVWDISLDDATIFVGDTDEKSSWTAHKHDIIFGTDGAFSRVRQRMQRQNRFNYSQFFLHLGYKELEIPANEDGRHKLDPKSFHIWPRREFMLIALPNIDGSFTCTLFMPFEGKHSFETINTEEKVIEFFKELFPDAVPLMPNLLKDYMQNPTSSLVTTQCDPWIYKDKIALLGDAAHAIVPFYGQGMNAGFEDITELYKQITENDDWTTILKNYQANRKPNADAIAELSFRNFKEMGSDTADKNFLLQKKIETKFTKKYPEKWLPLYDRVSFSLQPYSEVLKIADWQGEVMKEVMSHPEIETIWETDEIYELILEAMKNKKVK